MKKGRGPAMQGRARRTRKKLMAALESLLAEREFENIAVSDVAERAGVSVGSVYSHFADKMAFLDALLDEQRTRIEARLRDVLETDLEAEFRAQGGLRRALQFMAEHGLAQLQEDRHIIRATHNRMRLKSEAEWAGWDQLRRQAFETVAAVIRVYSDEVRRRDSAQCGVMLNFFLSTMLTERVVYRERGPFMAMTLSDDAFVSQIVEMAHAYLTTPDEAA